LHSSPEQGARRKAGVGTGHSKSIVWAAQESPRAIMSKTKTGQQGQKLGASGTAGTQQKPGTTNIASELEGKGIHSGRSLPKPEKVTTVDITANKNAALKAGLRQRTTADGSEASNPKKQIT
jgi:hypothetical protein